MAQPLPDPAPLDGGRGSADRALIARIAAAERWARTADRVAATAPARRGLRARFEREADPEGVLDVAERAPARRRPLRRAHVASGPGVGSGAPQPTGVGGAVTVSPAGVGRAAERRRKGAAVRSRRG